MEGRKPLSPMLWLAAIPAVLVLAVAGLVLRRCLAEQAGPEIPARPTPTAR